MCVVFCGRWMGMFCKWVWFEILIAQVWTKHCILCMRVESSSSSCVWRWWRRWQQQPMYSKLTNACIDIWMYVWLKQTVSATVDDDDDNVCKYVFHSERFTFKRSFHTLLPTFSFSLFHAYSRYCILSFSFWFPLLNIRSWKVSYVIATSQNDEMCKWHARML